MVTALTNDPRTLSLPDGAGRMARDVWTTCHGSSNLPTGLRRVRELVGRKGLLMADGMALQDLAHARGKARAGLLVGRMVLLRPLLGLQPLSPQQEQTVREFASFMILLNQVEHAVAVQACSYLLRLSPDLHAQVAAEMLVLASLKAALFDAGQHAWTDDLVRDRNGEFEEVDKRVRIELTAAGG